GITGGIGSGKTVVAQLLDIYGIPVYLADTESKRLTEESSEIKEGLTQLFGTDIYIDGRLNKAKLASIIFTDHEALTAVNKIIHPVVKNDFKVWSANKPIAAMESAILFESGFEDTVHYTICVSAPLETRIKRAIERDNLSRQQILDRINNQMPQEEKEQRSDFVVVNDGTHPLIPQVEKIVSILNSKACEHIK
ncbi:MAG: dephospho-CoA kinase, partial [Tannerellaceae bacterium]